MDVTKTCFAGTCELCQADRLLEDVRTCYACGARVFSCGEHGANPTCPRKGCGDHPDGAGMLGAAKSLYL